MNSTYDFKTIQDKWMTIWENEKTPFPPFSCSGSIQFQGQFSLIGENLSAG